MSTLAGGELIQRLSRFSDEYYCIIDRIEFYPGIIRIHIDLRGDNSNGALQDPMNSSLDVHSKCSNEDARHPTDGKFSISDASRQFLGYLDFSLDSSHFKDQLIGFRFGSDGYSAAKLFNFDDNLVSRYHIHEASKSSE